jgi:hypothetical protein
LRCLHRGAVEARRLSWLRWLDGSPPRNAPGTNLGVIKLQLEQRLGLPVELRIEDDLVVAEVVLTGMAATSLSVEKIVNRLERQIRRAADPLIP